MKPPTRLGALFFMNVEPIKALIQQNNSFVLTTHVNPDGDGLGCELALARVLRKLGKHATIINHSETPEQYLWLDPAKEILHFSPEQHTELLSRADVIVVLDTNHPDRLRSMKDALLNSNAVKAVIDHHLDADSFAQHYLINDDATSTGEIVYHLILSLDNALIDKEIARCLYTAIMTDTGSFRFPRTDPETHHIVAHLLECGADPTEIFSNVYEQWSSGRMRLLGEVLDSMKLAYDGKLAYVVCTRNMFEATGTTEVETDNFTSYPMSVRGVVVGMLINEMPNGVKISFRSKGEIPINKLANEFGGGGHLNAAGARIYNISLDDALRAVIEKAKKYVNAK
ncbi:MAG: bifunctional oligoribonuclease/PAP phosphatase NrnA [Bacteroidetes bacterium]|nr:MAG: bifunctional oligoribonuclease/PAP phosphatase NrnA [Bacteroidota bacterium]